MAKLGNLILRVMHGFERVINYLLIFVTAGILASSIKYNTINLFGFGFGTVMSESMLPDYEVGATILIEYGEIPKLGEVAVYDYGGMNVVHRVIRIQEDKGIKEYVFKGDNNEKADYYSVEEDKIVGVVKWRTNKTAKILKWLGVDSRLETFMHLMSFGLLVIIFIIIISSIKRGNNKQSNDKEKET